MSIAWKNKAGQWLVVSERHTHTGHHFGHSFTNDINEASAITILPLGFAERHGLQAVAVNVTRTVTIAKESDSPDSGKNIRSFNDLPLGTRFAYKAYPKSPFVILDRYGTDGGGLVAKWEGPGGPVVTQQVFSFAESSQARQDEEVIVLE